MALSPPISQEWQNECVLPRSERYPRHSPMQLRRREETRAGRCWSKNEQRQPTGKRRRANVDIRILHSIRCRNLLLSNSHFARAGHSRLRNHAWRRLGSPSKVASETPNSLRCAGYAQTIALVLHRRRRHPRCADCRACERRCCGARVGPVRLVPRDSTPGARVGAVPSRQRRVRVVPRGTDPVVRIPTKARRARRPIESRRLPASERRVLERERNQQRTFECDSRRRLHPMPQPPPTPVLPRRCDPRPRGTRQDEQVVSVVPPRHGTSRSIRGRSTGDDGAVLHVPRAIPECQGARHVRNMPPGLLRSASNHAQGRHLANGARTGRGIRSTTVRDVSPRGLLRRLPRTRNASSHRLGSWTVRSQRRRRAKPRHMLKVPHGQAQPVQRVPSPIL